GTSQATTKSASSAHLELPWLTVALVSARTIMPGAQLVYEVTATNRGSAIAPSATAQLLLPDGTRQTLELGAIPAGTSASVSVQWSVPPVAVREAGETLEAFLSRLNESDGRELQAAV